ncbi:MAG TPA: SdpI family protein [Armatimonadota bacterium]|jgi:uncharacterized membrane protein
MSARNAALAIAALTAAILAISAALYPSLPATVPMHWNAAGQPDGWAPKAASIAYCVGFLTLMGAMLWGLPWLSPRSFSIEPFRDTFNYVLALLAGMFVGIQCLAYYAALHPRADIGKPMFTLLFLCLAAIGNVLGKTRRNFYMGYRCPWTLASDKVWNATHRLGARLMFGAGVIGAAAVWLGAPMPACIAVFVVAVLAPFPYALALYKRLEREGALDHPAAEQ